MRSQDVPFSSDRILFSVDSPYEWMTELAPWFDSCPISDIDRQKIGRDNARSLFKRSDDTEASSTRLTASGDQTEAG